MLSTLYEREYLEGEYVATLMDIAYIRGVQDMKDAIILFSREIYDKNMKASQIWEALDEFVKSIEEDLFRHKEMIMKTKFPETWFGGIQWIKEKISMEKVTTKKQ